MDNKIIELKVRSANLNDRRQGFREKGGDIKANTALLKEENDTAKEFLNLSENGTTKEIRQSAYASFLELQAKIKQDTADLAKQTKGKVEVPAAPKAAPAKSQQAKVTDTKTPIRIEGPDDPVYKKLQKGDKFIDPDGNIREKG